ncbi:LexA family transcriptional regulator [Collimonas sp.]|jgi:phage repressor protein C with HTH and peptisase S24 domain|uniref:LexA family transcriptional regulator n=1 Tax=Collimonas sp. TaxID=1963772 RepID=UPI002B78FB1A|nr:LexA family transcriptional regulator [Collimonas sp.]HWW99629.1 LexA family transcriptional regulator [Collimonas sp.]
MEFKYRLKQLLDAKDSGNMTALATHCGVSPQAVQQWITKGLMPRKGRLELIAQYFGITESALVYGGDVPADTGEPVVISIRDYKEKSEEIEIRQYNTGGAMGHGVILRDQPGVIQSWHVSPEWIQKNVKHHTGIDNLAIVTGFGDSMRGMFNPGDPLLVDRGVKSVEFDSVYFFRVGDEGFIKRLQRIPGEGIVAISENKAYKEWTIKPDMDFEVFARILKVWCSTDF